MNNSTTLLDQILYHSQRPWLEENLLDIKFSPKLSEIQEIVPEFPMHYKIEFQRPFDFKTKYYQRLIQNAVVKDVSNILVHIRENDDESITYYLLNDLLDKKLTTRLKYIGELLQDKDYSLTYLGRNYIPSVEEKPHQANTFIMQLLKLAYMQVYLEIQEEYKKFRNDILIPEDFYSQYLSEQIPQQLPLTKLQVLEVEVLPTSIEAKTESAVKIPNQSFTYLQYDKGAEKLADVHDKLVSKGFIDSKTTLPMFKRIFSGKTVSTPVKWTGNRSELFFFINLLYQKYRLLADLKQKQWEVAGNCFVNSEGLPFDMQKIRLLKKPAKTATDLEYIVAVLK